MKNVSIFLKASYRRISNLIFFFISVNAKSLESSVQTARGEGP